MLFALGACFLVFFLLLSLTPSQLLPALLNSLRSTPYLSTLHKSFTISSALIKTIYLITLSPPFLFPRPPHPVINFMLKDALIVINFLPMYFKKEDLSLPPFLPPSQPPFLPIDSRLAEQYYALGLHPFSFTQTMMAAAAAEGKGKWSGHEQRLYIRYLEQNIEDMTNSAARKLNKVFLRMSMAIRTRSADQCRSHHQKILKYHNSVQHIIQSYKSRFNRREHEQEPAEASKKEDKTRADDQHVQGFYRLKRSGNAFSITIDPSAIQIYHL